MCNNPLQLVHKVEHHLF